LLLKQKMKKFNPQSTQDKCPWQTGQRIRRDRTLRCVSESITQVDPLIVARCVPYPIMVNEQSQKKRVSTWQTGQREQVSKGFNSWHGLLRLVGLSWDSMITLINREADLSHRERNEVALQELSKRIQTLFYNSVKLPNSVLRRLRFKKYRKRFNC
jgi:hypothetical protein